MIPLLYPRTTAKAPIAAVVKYDMSDRVTNRLKELIIAKFTHPLHHFPLFYGTV